MCCATRTSRQPGRSSKTSVLLLLLPILGWTPYQGAPFPCPPATWRVPQVAGTGPRRQSPKAQRPGALE